MANKPSTVAELAADLDRVHLVLRRFEERLSQLEDFGSEPTREALHEIRVTTQSMRRQLRRPIAPKADAPQVNRIRLPGGRVVSRVAVPR